MHAPPAAANPGVLLNKHERWRNSTATLNALFQLFLSAAQTLCKAVSENKDSIWFLIGVYVARTSDFHVLLYVYVSAWDLLLNLSFFMGLLINRLLSFSLWYVELSLSLCPNFYRSLPLASLNAFQSSPLKEEAPKPIQWPCSADIRCSMISFTACWESSHCSYISIPFWGDCFMALCLNPCDFAVLQYVSHWNWPGKHSVLLCQEPVFSLAFEFDQHRCFPLLFIDRSVK